MAKPSPASPPRLLVAELWGLGDIALALPFLREASRHAGVTLLAQPPAAVLLRRFAPDVAHMPFTAPWTAFRGKYRLHRWPWRELSATLRELRAARFDHAASARPDPREHLLLRLAGARDRRGFGRAGSGALLDRDLAPPAVPHPAARWRTLAASFGWTLPAAPATRPAGRRVVIHPGAAQPVRRWPRERYETIARRLERAGWSVTILDDAGDDLGALLDRLAEADRFIGNDSGPGHLAALLGVPTFTLFGPQLPERFAPQHAHAAWIDGAPCRFKPCRDSCRFARPHCLLDVGEDEAWTRIAAWLGP